MHALGLLTSKETTSRIFVAYDTDLSESLGLIELIHAPQVMGFNPKFGI